MRSFSIKKSVRPYGVMVIIFAFMMVIFAIILTSQVHAAEKAEKQAIATGARLVSIHEDGKTRGILTEATTLRDAFKQAGIVIDENDLVEPALDEELVASQYDVNVYRARPLTIVDGSVRKRVITPYQTAEQIAKEADITLQDEDIADFSIAVDQRSHSAGVQMVIDRATPFTFIMYGKKIEAHTQAFTVSEMLKEKNITLGKNDTLSVNSDTRITSGMTIELWREGKQVITEDKDVDFPVEQVRDAARPVGFKEVKTPGEKGKRTVSYEVVMKNGKELSRKEIRSVTTKEPKKQVEVIGTKQSLPPGSHQDWMRSAGISPDDYGYVNAIFTQESGWNPAAANPNGLYYGLGQTNISRLQDACGADWASDPICQITVFNTYAESRYGTWKNAYEFKFGGAGQSGTGWW